MTRRACTPGLVLTLTIAAVLASRPAMAGPPILHHPLDIGDARSLPWNSSSYWYEGDRSYDIHRVVADTAELLTPAMPVIVRMETIRRAAVYASVDAAIAEQLFNWIRARVMQPGAESNALAWFDAAYLTAAFHEMARLEYEPQFRTRAEHVRRLPRLDDAMQLFQKAISLRPDDAEMAFGGAIIAVGYDGPASKAYTARARLGMSRDAMLAANLNRLEHGD